jgi:hypothetical protein
VQSRFSESRLSEVPFRPSRCAAVKAASVLGTEFSSNAYPCVYTCISGISVLPFSRFLRLILYSVMWFKYVAVAQLVVALRYNPEAAGSIPDGVTGIFQWHNPSGRTMALGSTQPLTEMSTRNISWGAKAAGAKRLSRPVTGLLYLYSNVP